MSDAGPDIPRTDIPAADIPEAEVTTRRRRLPSAIWLVPVAAVLVAGLLVWQNYASRGPLVEIVFEDALGVAAGETELRYRDVTVGRVESVGFTDGLDRVLVSVRVDEAVAPYIDAGARFWVVRPQVSTRGVTGLSTVLSGVYLQGSWDEEPGGFSGDHVGFDAEPLFAPGRQGVRVVLTTEAGEGLNAEGPLIFKGLEVGRVAAARLSQDGSTVIADAVIFAPHDRFVTTSARFWDASGLTVSLGTGGLEVDFASVASLVSGGVAFDQAFAGGERVEDGATFRVFRSESEARAAMSLEPDGEAILLTAVFEGAAAGGLASGAPVELRGLRIGTVTAVAGVVDEARFGDPQVRLAATLEVQPERMGLPDGADPLDYLDRRVRGGLRARLVSASFLTGGLEVELADVEGAAPASLGTEGALPVLPTAASDLPDVAASASGLFERVSSLPLEELLVSATGFLDGAASLAQSPDLQAAPAELRGILADVRAITGSDGVQGLPGRVDAIAADVAVVAEEAAALLGRFDALGGPERLLATVDAAGAAAGSIGLAADAVPAFLTTLTALAADVRGLPLEEVVSATSGAIRGVEAIVTSEATQAIPGGARLAVDQLAAILSDAREREVVQALVDAAVAAEEAAVATEETALEFAVASEDLPDLIVELQGVAADVRALPIEGAVTELTELLASLDAVVGQDSTRRLPQELAQVTGSLSALLTDLEEAGAAERLAATLSAAERAADDVAAAAQGAPAIVANLEAVTATVRDLPLEPLVTQATAVVASADAILGQESTRDLPAALGAALTELSASLTELREGGTVENVNAALASARLAAEGVAQASGALPATVSRINGLIGQAESTLAAYDGDSDVAREARAALRDVQQAADAFASLARAIERRPNSLILGR